MRYTEPISECDAKDRELQELVILGVTHRSADQMESLSSLVIDESDKCEQLAELKEILDARELVYISTCNRVSVILITHRPPEILLKVLRNWFAAGLGRNSVPPAEQWIALRGRRALDHLLMVASSMDSMVVGEGQIFGQYKEAFKYAQRHDLSGSKLQFLFEQSTKVAKQVYSSTSLRKGRLSVVSLVEERLGEFCSKQEKTRVVLVATGKMIEKTAEYLRELSNIELIFVNRSIERAQVLADRFKGSVMPLAAFLQKPSEFDVLATSTAAPHHLFGPQFVEETDSGKPRLLIDLAVPPDIDPAVASMPNIELINMESLRSESASHKANRQASVNQAQRIIEEGAEKIIDRWKIRSINPAIGRLTRKHIQETQDQLNKLLETNLKDLSDSDKGELSKWVTRMAKHWAVSHASGVKETARHCCMKAVVSYLDGAGVGEAIN